MERKAANVAGKEPSLPQRRMTLHQLIQKLMQSVELDTG